MGVPVLWLVCGGCEEHSRIQFFLDCMPYCRSCAKRLSNGARREDLKRLGEIAAANRRQSSINVMMQSGSHDPFYLAVTTGICKGLNDENTRKVSQQ